MLPKEKRYVWQWVTILHNHCWSPHLKDTQKLLDNDRLKFIKNT